MKRLVRFATLVAACALLAGCAASGELIAREPVSANAAVITCADREDRNVELWTVLLAAQDLEAGLTVNAIDEQPATYLIARAVPGCLLEPDRGDRVIINSVQTLRSLAGQQLLMDLEAGEVLEPRFFG